MSVPPGAEAEQGLTELEGVPLTLLPVRLETRFITKPGAAAPSELRIRVYPDQVHVDAHEPGLTPAEIASGQTYWRNRWDPATAAAGLGGAHPRDQARPRRVDRALADARRTRSATRQGRGFRECRRGIRSSISRSRCARCRPAGWPSATTPAARKCCGGGSTTRSPTDLLATARLTDGPPITGDAAVSAYLGWAADYNTAVAAGMAATVTDAHLTDGRTLADGFDRLVVLGVDLSADAARGAGELAALLAAHEVSDGLGYLRPGTPTNNLQRPGGRGRRGRGGRPGGRPAAPRPGLVGRRPTRGRPRASNRARSRDCRARTRRRPG